MFNRICGQKQTINSNRGIKMLIYVYSNKSQTKCIGVFEADEEQVSQKTDDYGQNYTHVRHEKFQMITFKTEYVRISKDE